MEDSLKRGLPQKTDWVELVDSEEFECSCGLHHGLWISRRTQSTCNDIVTVRGPRQKVVSFFYDTDRNENMEDIEGNAMALDEFYPGWRMRVYHNVPSDSNEEFEELCDLQCKYGKLDICSIRTIPGYEYQSGAETWYWSYLPMADPMVDRFLSRDLSTRPSPREVTAVNDWIKSNLTFHVMRDHRQHENAIQGGMWGAYVAADRLLLRDLMAAFMNSNGRMDSLSEKDALVNILWPKMKDKVLQHDSYYCEKYSSHGNLRAWRTQRKHSSSRSYVGAVINEEVNTDQCPWKCRPYRHKNWLTC